MNSFSTSFTKNKYIEKNFYLYDFYQSITTTDDFLLSTLESAEIALDGKKVQKIDLFSYHVYLHSIISQSKIKKYRLSCIFIMKKRKILIYVSTFYFLVS